MRRLWVAGWLFSFAASALAIQPTRLETLQEVLRPALPFPPADATGELPATNDAAHRWFVAWPTDTAPARISVKANPLHPEVQKLGALAEVPIQQAVAAAERRAQAAYDRALEELRRTGKAADLDGITLDDEGVAGERIDAELELTIDLDETPRSFDIETARAPVVTSGSTGVTWMVSVPANVFRRASGPDTREHFRPAETRLYFGPLARPEISRRGDTSAYTVAVRPAAAFSVTLRGNEELLQRVLSVAAWQRLAP